MVKVSVCKVYYEYCTYRPIILPVLTVQPVVHSNTFQVYHMHPVEIISSLHTSYSSQFYSLTVFQFSLLSPLPCLCSYPSSPQVYTLHDRLFLYSGFTPGPFPLASLTSVLLSLFFPMLLLPSSLPSLYIHLKQVVKVGTTPATCLKAIA